MNNFNNKNFYPTPQELVRKMITKAKLMNGEKILEPSAGTGNIVEVVHQVLRSSHVDCVECDSNLRSILQQNLNTWNEENKKKISWHESYGRYNLIGGDFLEEDVYGSYNCILMNPPFDNGAKHLLKAIQLQERFGGKIVCILNAETLKNAYSNERQLLQKKLDMYNANIEYMQNAFSTAERKTNVEIALIYLNIVTKHENDFDFDKLDNYKKKHFSNQNEVAIGENTIENMVHNYNMDIMKAENFYEHYIYIQNLDICNLADGTGKKLSYQDIFEKVNKSYWERLFKRKEFTDKLTVDNYYKWQSEIDKLKSKAFTVHNINMIKEEVLKKAYSNLKNGAIEMFDKFTRHWFYDDKSCSNKWYFDGWKMNKAYMVGMKVKYPYNVLDSWGDYIKYDAKHWFDDFDKILDLFNNGEIKWNGDTCGKIVDEKYREVGTGVKIETKYAYIKLFKKGTVDFIFKEEARDIVKRFNIFCCKEKSWLPHTFGKEYENCDNEEKQAINNFYRVFNEGKKNNDYSLEYSKDRLSQTMIGIEMK